MERFAEGKIMEEKSVGEKPFAPEDGAVASSLCPICKNGVSKDFFPFCSRTCSYIDLGNWFNEAYTVPLELDFDDEAGKALLAKDAAHEE